MELHGIAYQQHVVDRCSRPHEEFFTFLLYLFLRHIISFFFAFFPPPHLPSSHLFSFFFFFSFCSP